MTFAGVSMAPMLSALAGASVHPLEAALVDALRGRDGVVLDFARGHALARLPAGSWLRPIGDATTFARASAAGRWPAAGPYEMGGADMLRYDHDPYSRAPLGVRLEASATNLCSNSEFPNGVSDAPTRSGATAVSDIEGGRTGIRLDNTLATAYAYKTVAITAGTAYTIGCIVEMEDGGAPVFAGAVNSALTSFALVLGGNVYAPMLIEQVGTKTWRVSRTGTAGPNTTAGVAQYASNEQRRIRVTGYQVETSPAATSYIATSAGAQLRAADNLALPLPVVPADGVTIAAAARVPRFQNAGDGNSLVGITAASGVADRLMIEMYPFGTISVGSYVGGSYKGGLLLASGLVADQEIYLAASWSAVKGWRGSLLGSPLAVQANATPPAATLTRLGIGNRQGVAQWGSTIERVAMWPHGDFTDAELQGLLS